MERKEWYITGKGQGSKTRKDSTGLDYSDSALVWKTYTMIGTREEFDKWSDTYFNECDSIFKVKDCGECIPKEESKAEVFTPVEIKANPMNDEAVARLSELRSRELNMGINPIMYRPRKRR